ncbi:MAG: hypothetical protein HY426_02750 [Candidatus Levybacteria bacterium]|nr:hypothetical protein [Candidatus Levybacteria bacterium]
MSGEPGNSETRYNTEVSTLEEPLTKILSELKPNFEQEEYGLILGDDTSGRLPTLIIKGVADYISLLMQREKIPTVFIQAGRSVSTEDVERQFEERVLVEIAKHPDKKVLLVTDYIQTGTTINRLTSFFEKHNVAFDLVALSEERTGHASSFSLPLDSIPYIADEDSQFYLRDKLDSKPAPEIWAKEHLTGLKREPAGVSRRTDYRKYVIAARQDVKMVISKIIGNLYPDQRVV